MGGAGSGPDRVLVPTNAEAKSGRRRLEDEESEAREGAGAKRAEAIDEENDGRSAPTRRCSGARRPRGRPRSAVLRPLERHVRDPNLPPLSARDAAAHRGRARFKLAWIQSHPDSAEALSQHTASARAHQLCRALSVAPWPLRSVLTVFAWLLAPTCRVPQRQLGGHGARAAPREKAQESGRRGSLPEHVFVALHGCANVDASLSTANFAPTLVALAPRSIVHSGHEGARQR